jgi:hypothetical protein
MKILSNIYVSRVALAIFSTTVLIAAPGYAVTNNTTRTTTTASASPFCTKLPTLTATINQSVAERTSKMISSRQVADDKRTETRATVDERRTADRQKWDAQRDTALTELDTKALTPEQKAAAETYKQTVLDAVAVRRAANDEATKTFRSGIDALVTSHRAAIDQQITTFKATIQNAQAAATKACASNSQTSAAAFRATLKGARTTFKIDRAADVRAGEQVKALAATRNANMKANDATMKATIDSARDALKLQLKEA